MRLLICILLGLIGAAPVIGLGFWIGWDPDGLLHKLALVAVSFAAPSAGWWLIYQVDKRHRLLG